MADANTRSVKTERKKYVDGYLSPGENSNLLLPTSENIRILLFKECPLSDRELIFDSHLSSRAPTNNQTDLNKNNPEEFSHLTELIFGSAAMKYHDTYYKINDASSPDQIIFTQVFSSPKKLRLNTTTVNQSTASLSTNSSSQDSLTNSLSQASLNSKSNYFSLILRNNISPNLTSSTIDSGFSDFSSNLSLNQSCGSFTRRNSSNAGLNSCGSFSSDSESSKSLAVHFNYIRLGLALILHKPAKNPIPENLYLQNIPIIESILWRVRQYVEIALNSPRLFLSTMLEISLLSAKWLSKELNFWTKTDSTKQQSYCGAIISIFKNHFPKNLFFRTRERDEKFVRFCQTVEELESKETKFFLSTLLTAVLTHHTGWIATCYNLEELSLNESYHAVWNQLTNLFGATGYMTKTSKTVVYGLKNDNTIKKVVNFIQYFIRYLKIERQYIERLNIAEENKLVDEICDKARQDSIVEELPILKKSGLSRMKTSKDDLTQLVDFNEESFSGMLEGFSNEVNGFKKKGISKSKAVGNDLFRLSALNEESDSNYEELNENPVLFILGDHEKLQNLKNPAGCTPPPAASGIIEDRHHVEPGKLKMVKFPLPKFKYVGEVSDILPSSFLPDNDILENIIPDKLYQGTNIPKKKWKDIILNDLSLKKSCIFPGDIEENVAILGDTDKWNVQVWSSLRKRMIKNEAENTVDSSPLISNMLDVLLQMWKENMSKEQCSTFMEQKLIEICLKANALTQFLLTTEFCSMDVLLKTLNLNVLDVPLLMSVGSNINPLVLQKYGLSYQ